MQITEGLGMPLHDVVIIQRNPTAGPLGEIERASHDGDRSKVLPAARVDGAAH